MKPNMKLANDIRNHLVELQRLDEYAYEECNHTYNLSIPLAELIDFGIVTGIDEQAHYDLIMLDCDIMLAIAKVNRELREIAELLKPTY